MTIIAERIPSTWFERLTMTGHPESFDSPFALSLSKGERFAQDRLVEGYRNVCANNDVVMYRSRFRKREGARILG